MKPGIIESVKKAIREKHRPDGTSYRSISITDIAGIAENFKLLKRQVETIALEHDVFPERYIRNMNALSAKDQSILLESHVGIVGLGGLGGTVAEILARLGVGSMTLIDGDVFDESNLNRQLISTERNLNCRKAEEALRRISTVNSSTTVYQHAGRLNGENAAELLGQAQVAVDCLDNITSRFVLESVAKKLDIPLVSAAVGGYVGQLTTIFPGDKGLELVYGPPETLSSPTGSEVRLGNLPFTVSVVASLESAEVVNVLLKKEPNLRNRLLLIDLQDYSFERIRLM